MTEDIESLQVSPEPKPGKRRTPATGDNICPVCKGTGFMDDEKSCTMCGGTGHLPLPPTGA